MKIKIDPADTVFSQAIRTRDKFRCQRCGRYYPDGKKLQCSHFYSRRFENTRYNPDNCIALCFTCHNYFHANPREHTDFFMERLNENGMNQLAIQSHTYKKKDRKMRLLEAKAYLKLMQEENNTVQSCKSDYRRQV